MKEVLLEIVGTQRIDRQRDKLEMTTVGTLEENDRNYIIKYKEEQEPPCAPVDVCVTVSKTEDLVEMTRSGASESCLIIERSKRNLCHYATDYGDILMGISGHSIDVHSEEEKGSFYFSYDIDFNGALASKNEVKLSYKNNQS